MKTHPRFPNLFILYHPLIQHKLTHMRQRERSTNGFRMLLRELSLLMGYEITRDLPMTTIRIETPLEAMEAPVQIGRASCRERVCQYVYISVSAVALKKQLKT